MGLCDSNNSSSYSDGKTTSITSRKSSIGNITSNGFVGLPGKADDELNLNAESFISENATISFLPSVDADNPDPLPIKKPTEPTNKHSLPQRTSLVSSRSEDVSVHENDVEKGINEFSKVMDQVIKREESVSHQMRRNSSSTSLCQLGQLPDLPQLPTTSSAAGNSTKGSSSSPPPYPGTSLSSSTSIQQAAQQLASAKNKFQHLVANMDHLPSVSQPQMGVVEPTWQQQQQMIAAKQQQQQQHQMMMQQQQQQHYHNAHQTKMAHMQRKPQQQQQYDFLKSASPNVTIVSRDPYHSAAAMQQQQQSHVMLHQSMTMHQHQQMMHLNSAPVQTMGQPTQLPQQPPPTMSRNQPQIYAPLPNADPYLNATIDQHSAMTSRSNSIPYGGPIDGQHLYQHQHRRHSMPPQLPTQQQQQVQWQQGAVVQHQDLMYEGFCTPTMDPHQHSMAGHKRGHSYLPPQVAIAKRNSIQHSTALSHTLSPSVAGFQQQHNTLVNGELNQAFHNPINDHLLHFDSRNDLFNTPL